MHRRPLRLLVLALLLASSPAIAREELSWDRAQPSFLVRFWEEITELAPLFAPSERPADPAPAPSGSDPDRGLGLDPNG